jgi:hypothetical protein
MMEFVRAHLRRALPLSAGVGVVILAACEVPEAPEWDIDVSVPFSSDPIAIVDFLPSEVDTASVSSVPVFTVDPQADSMDYTLGQMCSACGVLQGVTTNVPGFTYQDSLDVDFPPELVSVELESAQLGLFVDNGLNFDPLRPGAGGFLTITVHDLGSGALVDSVLMDGATQSLPAGTRTQIDLDITDVDITQGLRVVVNVNSPLDAQTVTINNNLSARFGAVLDQIMVRALVAVVDNAALDEEFMVDLDEDLRQEISESVQAAEYELELTHTLEIAGTLDVSIAGSQFDLFSGNPANEIRLGPHNFVSNQPQTGTLSVQDMQQIAGFINVYVGYRGVASGSGAGNTSRFTPDQALQADFKLTATVRVGS